MNSAIKFLLIGGIITIISTATVFPFLGCVTGEGEVEKQALTVAPFDGIVLQGALDVVIHTTGKQGVMIEGQANLIDLLTTEVESGTWYVTTSKCYTTNKPFVVHISTSTLEKIHVQGSGDVRTEGTIKSQRMDLRVDGSGDISVIAQTELMDAHVSGSGYLRISGSTNELATSVTGSGDVHAFDLEASDVSAEVTGSGYVRVHANNTLKATVTGSGGVTYRGEAEVTRSVTGSGDISRESSE